MGTIEQRRHPRVNVEFFADWGWGPECEFYDRVTSLSVSGCFLNTKRELNAGQEIYIKWTAEVAGAISLKGRGAISIASDGRCASHRSGC